MAQGMSNPSGYGYPIINNASLAAGKCRIFMKLSLCLFLYLLVYFP